MKTIQQDMLELRSGILFHQVNCQGIMGGGIAKAFADKWPKLEKEYRQFCEGGPLNLDWKPHELLGKVNVVTVDTDLHVANIFGQNNVSRSSRQTSYDATVTAFEMIDRHRKRSPSSKFNQLPLYFPFKMGCGLGGGDWDIYSAIINRYFPDGIICQHNV